MNMKSDIDDWKTTSNVIQIFVLLYYITDEVIVYLVLSRK
jgi:hypothetical protein